MAYKQIRRRTRPELGENEGATQEVSQAHEVSQIQTERELMTSDDALDLQDMVGNQATGQIMGAASTPPPRTGYVQPKAIPPQPMRPGGSPHAPAYAYLQRKPTLQRASYIQRKSDKLKTRATYLATAKSGFKLGTTQYDKIFNAVNVYHGLGANNYMAQLQQLVRISAELNLWEISHGLADTNQANKNNKEAARRGVLVTLKSTDLPQEIADVYQQAKNAGSQPDVHLLMKLMDATAGNPGVRGTIEQDYATALRTYQATQNDTLNAENILTAQGSTFFASINTGGTSLSSKLNSVRNLTTDPSSGRMDEDIMDAPIRQNDSDSLKQIKKLRQKLVPLVPAIANMSDMEIMAISAYTDEGGYTPMVGVLRGGDPVAGGSKNARKANAKSRAEIQQANLMASSGLNKLPDWDGSDVFRGEDIGWLGHDPANGDVVVLKSFTSTTLNEGAARGFASKGTAQTSAVWCISGVTNQGKDISKLSVVQQEVGIGSGQNVGTQEDEILLKPYTSLRIDQVTQGNGYRWHIEATAL